jgi:hypothetical protein
MRMRMVGGILKVGVPALLHPQEPLVAASALTLTSCSMTVQMAMCKLGPLEHIPSYLTLCTLSLVSLSKFSCRNSIPI